MKNKSNDPIFCGKLVKESPITIEINILDGDDVKDNIEGLSDFGYGDSVTKSIEDNKNVLITIEGVDGFEKEVIDAILNYEKSFDSLTHYKSKTIQENEKYIFEFLKLRCEFMGIFVDAR